MRSAGQRPEASHKLLFGFVEALAAGFEACTLAACCGPLPLFLNFLNLRLARFFLGFWLPELLLSRSGASGIWFAGVGTKGVTSLPIVVAATKSRSFCQVSFSLHLNGLFHQFLRPFDRDFWVHLGDVLSNFSVLHLLLKVVRPLTTHISPKQQIG